jgi:hypothetical protein
VIMKVLAPLAINDTTLLGSTLTETDYAAWSAMSIYGLGGRVILTGPHRVYESLAAGNLNHSPDTSPSWWRDIGPTNKWAMFDESLATATVTATSPLRVRVSVGAINDIVLLGVVGSTINIYRGTGTGTLVRSVAVPAPTAPASSVTMVITGLAIPADEVVVELVGTGTIAIAHMSVGTYADIGKTQRDIQLDMDDFSTKETDAFGVVTVVRRGYSRRLTVPVSILASQVDSVTGLIESLRSKVCYWSAMDGYDSLAALGIYTNFDEVLQNKSGSTYSLTIEALVRDDALVDPGPQAVVVDPWMDAAQQAAPSVLSLSVFSANAMTPTGNSVNICSITYTPKINCVVQITVSGVAQQRCVNEQWSSYCDITTYDYSSVAWGSDDRTMTRNIATSIGEDTKPISKTANYNAYAGVTATYYFNCCAPPSSAGRSLILSNVNMRLEAMKI